METIDIIIGLLETGKTLCNESGETEGHKSAAIQKIIDMINQLTGYERPQVITDYITGKVNLQNTILRLVVDVPKQPLTPISTPLVPYMRKRVSNREAFPEKKRKRGHPQRYNKEMCIEILKEISSHLGPNFSRMDYIRFTREHDGYPNHMTLVKHVCGRAATWEEVLSIAGLHPLKYPIAK